MRGWGAKLFRALAGFLILVTALPLINSNEWWIRLWDFPRAQIAVLLTVALAAGLLWRGFRGRGGALLGLGLAVALGYQITRIWPYSPLHPTELPGAASCRPEERIRLAEINVLQDNRDFAAVRDLVARERPDLVLLTETDAAWARSLEPLHPAYPHRVEVPLPNTYGMLLFSRFPLTGTDVRTLLEPDVPSIRTNLRLPSGRQILFYGVHPRPPVPGHDTAQRDAELVVVGREIRRAGRPTIVAGDLNDVAWSDTTRLFRKVSGLKDPRVGRRLMPTFPADYPGLRWPLDYVFVTPGFTLLGMTRFGDVGSDHLPVAVDLCAERLGKVEIAPTRLDAETREEVREVIQEGVEEAREDAADARAR